MIAYVDCAGSGSAATTSWADNYPESTDCFESRRRDQAGGNVITIYATVRDPETNRDIIELVSKYEPPRIMPPKWIRPRTPEHIGPVRFNRRQHFMKRKSQK